MTRALSRFALPVLLAGCSDWFDGVDNLEQVQERKRAVSLAKELREPDQPQVREASLDGLIVATRPPPPSVLDGPSRAEIEPEPATVILIVLDSVRADHLAVCGYGRPTTPAFKTLLSLGGELVCDAYAPATWTQPSHATMFTGQPIFEHDMHRKGLSLAEEASTLAEVFAERGYQTLAISANPVLKPQTGLMQGFQRVIVPPGLVSALRGEGLSRVLKSELARLDKTKPLFLFLNVFDAHDPYPAIPEGIPWVGPRETFRMDTHTQSPSNPYYRYISGKMDPSEQEAYLQHATDTYDFGIAIADRSLGKMLKLIQKQGWIEHGVRMIVTSDHGEHLGEHGLMRHDGPPWEPVARVPFYYLDTSVEAEPPLPTPFSTAQTFHLLTTGQLDGAAGPPISGSIRYGKPDPRYADAVATWAPGGDKLTWGSGQARRFDLTADPLERSPSAADGHPLAATLDQAVAAMRESKARAEGARADDEVIELLGELGYNE